MLFPLGENLPFPGKTGPSSRAGAPLPLSCFYVFGHRHTTLNSVVRTHSVHILYLNQRRCRASPTPPDSYRDQEPPQTPPQEGLCLRYPTPPLRGEAGWGLFPSPPIGGIKGGLCIVILYHTQNQFQSLHYTLVSSRKYRDTRIMTIRHSTMYQDPVHATPTLHFSVKARWGLDPIPRPCRPMSALQRYEYPSFY